METIHIIAPFINANGDDWCAIDMYLRLHDDSQVFLWCEQTPHADLAAYPIRNIKAYQGEAPSGGTLYIYGSATTIGRWYDQIKFKRIVLMHNRFDQDAFYRSMHRLVLDGKRRVEINYVSKMVRDTIGLPGEIYYPQPHPARFKPVALQERKSSQPFTVGRIGADSIGKHHYHDIDIYRELAQNDIQVKIFGGTCLAAWLGNQANIELLPAISHHKAPEIHAMLDCFYYRTSAHNKDAFSIEVAEAIASELPIVCFNDGGHTEIVSGYEKGFLFETKQEALDLILGLRSTNTKTH